MNPLRQFLSWWGGQLADWLPEGLRRRLTAHRTVLLLRPGDDNTWRVLLRHGRQEHLLGQWPGLDAEQLRTALRPHPTPQHIELQLPADQYLARQVELPLAAADDLSQAVGYQIETLTPFRRDQQWLFCGEQQRLPDGKRLRAWLVAVPHRAAAVLGELGLEVSGAPERGPRQAPAAGAPLRLGFRPRQAGGGLPLGWLLAALNLAALLLAAGLHLDNRQAELALLKNQGRGLQQQAIAASDLAHEAEQLQQRLDTLQRLRQEHPLRVAVLEELSRRLDDQTWLQRLELRGQQLRLQGSSTDASALIGALDAAPLFSDVRFEAALTRDPFGGERFNLTGRMDSAAGKTPEQTP